MPLTNTALNTLHERSDDLRSGMAGARRHPVLIEAGHRILFLDTQNAATDGVRRQLEEMGHKTAWIGMASEEHAGLAFQPDLIVMNPDASIGNDHAFIALLDKEQFSGTLTLLRPSVHFGDAIALAEQSGIDNVDWLDTPFTAQDIADRLPHVARQPHDGDIGDRHFLSWLIQQGRLLPNLTHEFHEKRSLRDEGIAGYKR